MVVITDKIRPSAKQLSSIQRATRRSLKAMPFCIRCGEDDPLDLTAHHIKARRDGGGHNIENLATLCRDCHDLWHNKFERTKIDFVDWIIKPL